MLTVHTYGESSESLEGYRGRDRVRHCRLFNVIPEIILSRIFRNSTSKIANCIIVARYYKLSYAITGKLLATHFLFFISFD